MAERLDGIARMNIIFGAASLIRLVTELLFFWSERAFAQHATFAVFDGMVGALWLSSGLLLRSRRGDALESVAMAAGAAAAHTLLPIVLVLPHAPQLLEWILKGPDAAPGLAGIGSRFLHYGIEMAYWPYVLVRVLRASEALSLRRRMDCEFPTGLTFAVTGVMAGLFQAAVLDLLVR